MCETSSLARKLPPNALGPSLGRCIRRESPNKQNVILDPFDGNVADSGLVGRALGRDILLSLPPWSQQSTP